VNKLGGSGSIKMKIKMKMKMKIKKQGTFGVRKAKFGRRKRRGV